MATWVRQGTGTAPSQTDADLVGEYSLDNATAPVDFDPATVNSVRIEWTITGSGFGDDSWTNDSCALVTAGGTEISQHPSAGGTNLQNTSEASDHTDSTGIPAGLTTTEWEGARVRGDGVDVPNEWVNWNKVMGPDGSTLAVSALTVTIDYTPASGGTAYSDAVTTEVTATTTMVDTYTAAGGGSGPTLAFGQNDEITSTDFSNLANPAGEWYNNHMRPVWWNGYASRWDGVLPAATAAGAATASDWWLFTDLAGTPALDQLVESHKWSRPDVYWDETAKTVYVLLAENNGVRGLHRFDYDDVGDTYTLRSGDPVSIPHDGGFKKAVMTKSPNGDLWVSASSDDFLEIQINKSTDDGDTWAASAMTLKTVAASGDSHLVNFHDGTENRVGVATSEDDTAASPIVHFLHIGEGDAGWETPGNWTDETTSLPALSGTAVADDELSAAAYNDIVYITFETGSGGTGDDQLVVFKRATDGTWTKSTVHTVEASTVWKRPTITIDSEAGEAVVIATDPNNDETAMFRAAIPGLSSWDGPTNLFSGVDHYNPHVPRGPVDATSDLLVLGDNMTATQVMRQLVETTSGGASLSESLSTSISSTTTASDSLNTAEALSTSIAATTTVADAKSSTEALSTSITATTASADAKGSTEALSTSITSTTAAADTSAMAEALATSATATTTASDTLSGAASEALSTSITATTTASDALSTSEVVATSISSTTTATDQLGLGETLTTSISSATAATDSVASTESLSTSVTVTTSTSSTMTATDALSTSITATTRLTDNLAGAGLEELTTSITATTTASDALTTSEALATSITATTTASDALAISDSVTTSITATTSTADTGALTDSLTVDIVATTTASDALATGAVSESLTTDIVATTSLVDAFVGLDTLITEGIVTTTLYDRYPWTGVDGATTDRGLIGSTTDRGRHGSTTDRGRRGSTADRGSKGYTD